MAIAASKPGMALLILILLALIALAVLPIVEIAVDNAPPISHAVLRHGREALVARECMNGWELRMYNPTTERTGLICMTSEGKWGIVILNKYGEEITAFLKNKAKTLEQVIRYMRNAGYELIQ